jgi:chromosome segregation ATPase
MDRSDFEAKQRQLASISETAAELKRKIAVKEETRKRLADLQSRVEAMKKANDDEELQQMEELAEVTADLHALRNPDFSKRLFNPEKKLSKLESTFANHIERFEKNSQTIEDLKDQEQENEAQLQPIKTDISRVKQHCRELDRFKGRLPAPVPILFQMEDLENARVDLQSAVAQNRANLELLQSKVASFKSKKLLRIAELERANTDADGSSQDVVQIKGRITAAFNELEALSTSLQAINVAMKSEVDKSQAARSEIEALRAQMKSEMTRLSETLSKRRQEVAALPNRMRVLDDGTQAVLNKKRIIVEQLQKKLSDLKQDLMSRYSDTPVVQDLTKELEREWMKHQKLFDIFVKKNALMLRAQEEVERTETAIREIEMRWPMNGKVREKKGIEEMEFIYDAVLITNRQLAVDFSSLKDEVAVLEEMNTTLKAALAL